MIISLKAAALMAVAGLASFNGVRAWQDDYPVFPTQTATSSPTPTPTPTTTTSPTSTPSPTTTPTFSVGASHSPTPTGTPTGTPTPTPSSSPLPWFDVVAAIRNEPELTFFNDLLDYQPNLPQLWQMMDPTVWAPTNGAFHHLFKRFPAFLEWLLGYPSCFAFNRLEYFLQTHATALYVPKFSVVTAPLRTRLVRTMAPHPEELLKLVAARVQVLDDADDAASSLGGILRRLEAPTDADTTSSATDPTVPWAVSAEERKLQSSFAAHTVRKSGVERQLIVNTETGPSSENDYRIVVDTARNWNLYRSPRELASGYVANGFLYAIDRVIKPSADARATFPDQSLLQFVSEHPALTEFAALLRYADIQCVSDFAQEGYTYHDAGRIWVAGDDVEADHTYGGWDWGATNRSHYARRRCNADIHAITIFLPTNAAFDAMSLAAKVWLLEERNFPFLLDILKYHVIRGNTYLYQCPFFELNRNFGNVTETMSNNCPLFVYGTGPTCGNNNWSRAAGASIDTVDATNNNCGSASLTLKPGPQVPWVAHTQPPNVDIELTDAMAHKIDRLLVPPHVLRLMPQPVYS